MAKAYAIFNSVQTASSLGIKKLFLESDNEPLGLASTGVPNCCPWEIRTIVEDIQLAVYGQMKLLIA